MTLGRKIADLRNAHKMSQADLAEKLNVSRQSVSKWETDTSIPDLERLIMMSGLFQISMDELTKDEQLPAEHAGLAAESRGAEACATQSSNTQRVVGFILIGVGLLCGTLALAFSSPPLLIALAFLLLSGVICLAIKKNAALLIGWILYIPIIPVLPFVTSTHLGAVFYPSYYKNGLYVQLGVSVALWIILFLLLWSTIKLLRRKFQTRQGG